MQQGEVEGLEGPWGAALLHALDDGCFLWGGGWGRVGDVRETHFEGWGCVVLVESIEWLGLSWKGASECTR